MDKAINQSNIYLALPDKIREKKSCVLATVVDKYGSTPQIPGCSAIFGNEGLMVGTVGGGKVEHHIQNESKAALQSGESKVFRFELNDDISEEDSSICGGGMAILLDASPEKHLKVFESMKESLANREPGVLITLCGSDKSGKLDVSRLWSTKKAALSDNKEISADVINMIREMLEKPKKDDFREIVVHTSPETEDNYTFLETIIPLPVLVIAGAGHVGKALSHLGKLLDFKIIVWDDREEYANKNNLPDADKILTGSMEDSLGKIKTGKDIYIVIVTRGHKNDSKVLKHFIKSGAGYIGMIGSRNKVMQVREKFIKEGWIIPQEWERIHAPIGLKIASKTVEEIAVSIAAELILVRDNLNRGNG